MDIYKVIDLCLKAFAMIVPIFLFRKQILTLSNNLRAEIDVTSKRNTYFQKDSIAIKCTQGQLRNIVISMIFTDRGDDGDGASSEAVRQRIGIRYGNGYSILAEKIVVGDNLRIDLTDTEIFKLLGDRGYSENSEIPQEKYFVEVLVTYNDQYSRKLRCVSRHFAINSLKAFESRNPSNLQLLHSRDVLAFANWKKAKLLRRSFIWNELVAEKLAKREADDEFGQLVIGTYFKETRLVLGKSRRERANLLGYSGRYDSIMD